MLITSFALLLSTYTFGVTCTTGVADYTTSQVVVYNQDTADVERSYYAEPFDTNNHVVPNGFYFDRYVEYKGIYPNSTDTWWSMRYKYTYMFNSDSVNQEDTIRVSLSHIEFYYNRRSFDVNNFYIRTSLYFYGSYFLDYKIYPSYDSSFTFTDNGVDVISYTLPYGTLTANSNYRIIEGFQPRALITYGIDKYAQDFYDTGYDTGYDSGYDTGYNTGYTNGLTDDRPLATLFYAVTNAPFFFLHNMFGYELWGFNLYAVLQSLITFLIMFYIIRKCLGFSL